MGFFSFNCEECGHPMLSHYVSTEANDWMTHVVAHDMEEPHG